MRFAKQAFTGQELASKLGRTEEAIQLKARQRQLIISGSGNDGGA